MITDFKMFEGNFNPKYKVGDYVVFSDKYLDSVRVHYKKFSNFCKIVDVISGGDDDFNSNINNSIRYGVYKVIDINGIGDKHYFNI